MSTDPTPVAHVERTSFQARAAASVLRLATSDAGPRGTALSGLRLGTSVASVDSVESPRSAASAVQVTGPPGVPPAAVTRSAGNGDDESGTMTRTTSGAELPFLTLGSSRLTADAQWSEAIEPTVLSSALALPGELVLHPRGSEPPRVEPGSDPSASPAADSPLMHVWRGSQTRTQTQLVAVPGQPTLGVRATARTELTAITLFRGESTEVTIRFLTSPSLVAVAAGTDRTDVRYAAPVVAVTAAHGRSYRLDAAGESVEVPLAGPGCCGSEGLMRISLGGVRERTGHTSVDVTASAVRLQILGSEDVGRLLDATIGDLDVSARVPMGGLGAPCGVCAEDEPRPGAGPVGSAERAPSTNAASPPPERAPERAPERVAPSPVPSLAETPVAGAGLPLTGTRLSVLAALGLALLGVGWVVVRAVRRPRR